MTKLCLLGNYNNWSSSVIKCLETSRFELNHESRLSNQFWLNLFVTLQQDCDWICSVLSVLHLGLIDPHSISLFSNVITICLSECWLSHNLIAVPLRNHSSIRYHLCLSLLYQGALLPDPFLVRHLSLPPCASHYPLLPLVPVTIDGSWIYL